ncbi:MAG TPA: 2'-5' RNA ligase family protein, partial [Roseiflexaceae bacterium]|nr:2'-5' RNA ligase family protein [Roseiflexaceae bacterium]
VFALLVDQSTHNFMRKLAFELDRLYHTGLQAAVLPAHVSLKQTFRTDDLPAVEAYFDTFAASIQPFEIIFDAVEVQLAAGPNGDTGIVWLAARETSTLRDLHNRLNAELAPRLTRSHADFDGPAFRFHSTIAMGKQAPQIYQAIAATYSRVDVHLTCYVTQILMGVAYDDTDPPGPFISYKILSLQG